MKNRCFSFMRSGSLFCVYGGRLTGFWCVLVLLLWGAVSVINSASLLASATPQISCGNRHSLSMKSDGTVWAWGENKYGQLGDGTTTDRSTPVQVNTLAGIIAVACGGSHGLAVESDGTVWSWGDNGTGELGDGTTTDRETPIQVNGLSDIIAVACGGRHSLAVESDRTVWAWGDAWGGGLGTYRETPVRVSSLSGVIAVAGGYSYSLALKSDGTVWAWGDNEDGQLGDGTTDYRNDPVQVNGLSDIIAVACGSSHSLALKSDGTVLAWGNNEDGRLGDRTTTNSSTPVQVSGLGDVIVVAAGDYHSLALKSDGTVWAWGDDSYGQLGNRGVVHSNYAPVQVDSLSDVIAIASGSTHSLALKSDGTVWAWGSNGKGQLGDGTATDRSTPVQVSSINLYDTTTTPTPTPIPTSASAQLPDAGVAPVQYDPTTKRFARLLTDKGGVYFGYRYSSGEWGNEFVCTYYGGDAQLLFDSEGVPHVFVNSEDSEYKSEVLQMFHWRKAATGWKLVEKIDLPIGGSTVVRFGNGNGNGNDIHLLDSGYYGTNVSGTWVWENTGAGGGFYPFTFGFYGWHHDRHTIDLAIDSQGYAHVIGHDTYATNKSGSWTTQVVDKRFDISDYSEGDYEVLWASTMAVSPITQQPAVVFWGSTHVETGSIKASYLTYYTPRKNGRKWRKQTIPADVDGYVGPDGRRGSGGAGARLQFDEDGLPHVVFCDMATGHNPHQYSVVGQIRHAVRGEGGEWSVKTVYRQTDHTKEGMLNVAMALGDSAILFAGNRVKKVNSKRKVRPVFVRKKIDELFIKE